MWYTIVLLLCFFRVLGYYSEGFLSVQRAVDLAIISEFNPSAAAAGVSLQMKRQPFPSHRSDPFIKVIQQFLPIFILLNFLVLAPNICKDITLEKEEKLKVCIVLFLFA